ncbi:MAG: hypothetical protein HOG99_00080 [Gemmatimonadetes bacterium]|nr:hypothetical protein [Gemmatimonadota bacterium]MBT5959903.1 hypothetical protein [Gemmatimonadota bacterium]
MMMPDLIVDTRAHIYNADETRLADDRQTCRPPVGTGDIEHLRREAE